VADVRCTAIETKTFVKMIKVHTHRRAGARPDLYFVISVPCAPQLSFNSHAIFSAVLNRLLLLFLQVTPLAC